MAFSNEFLMKRQHAVRLLRQGDLTGARRLCEQLCAVNPRDPGMLCMLGYICGQQGQYQASAELCRQALEISPDYVQAHFYYGTALRLLGQTEMAIGEFEYVLSKWPRNVEARYELGLVLAWAGDFDGALAAFRTVQRMKPDHMGAIANEAIVYEKRGETEAAWKLIQPYVENRKLDNGIMAVTYGKLAMSTGRQDTAIAGLERVLELENLSVQERGGLHYILGMLYDSRGEYDQAFSHFEQANRSKYTSFDAQGFNDMAGSLLASFSRENYARAPRSDCQSERPLFVVGMMRSGTSLVEQILSSHSRVYGAGELPHIDRAVAALNEACPQITRLDAGQLNRQAARYLDLLGELSADAAHVVDKMPQNFMHLGYISLLFPRARIIHCTRNALDTCLSCYFQNFSVVHTYTFDLEALGYFYNEYRRVMDHWQHSLGIEVHEVTYESMVANPEREIAALLEYCGLEWEAACLDFHQNRRAVATASYGQVRRPLYSNSVSRWMNYEEHIGPLRKVLACE